MPVDDHMRHLRGKHSASRVAHDVIQKTLRPMHRTVLVIDYAVRVVAIGFGNQLSGCGEIIVAPGAELEAAGELHPRLPRDVADGLHHEQAAKHLKARLPETARMCTGRMQKQLRFNAVDMG